MPSVLVCPECASFLLVRVGSPSPLDGKKALRCLACRTSFQPRRPKPLYAFFFALAILFAIASGALVLYMILEGSIGATFRALVATGTGGWAMFLIHRAMGARVPALYDTREFPHPQVQLTEMKVRAEAGADREWVRALGGFLTEVIRLSGQCLAGGEGTYKACLKLELVAGQRTVALSYRGKPSESALSALFDEIERLPAFHTPDTPVSIELWFGVTT